LAKSISIFEFHKSIEFQFAFEGAKTSVLGTDSPCTWAGRGMAIIPTILALNGTCAIFNNQNSNCALKAFIFGRGMILMGSLKKHPKCQWVITGVERGNHFRQVQ
jgi:hypothetical protein